MRIAFALVCLVVLGTMTGAGLRAVGSARQMSSRQLQDLDTAIDRIVAEHKERRETVLATTGASTIEERANQRAIATADTRTVDTRNAAGAAKPVARPDPTKMAGASPSKNQRPRAARTALRNNGPIPQAFISLQKFATTTFFGLR